MPQYSYPSAYAELPYNPAPVELPPNLGHTELPAHAPLRPEPLFTTFRAELSSQPRPPSEHTSPPGSVYQSSQSILFSPRLGSQHSSPPRSQYSPAEGSQFSLPLRSGPLPRPPSSISPASASSSSIYGPPSNSSTFYVPQSSHSLDTLAELPAEPLPGPSNSVHSQSHGRNAPQGYQYQNQTPSHPTLDPDQFNHFQSPNHFYQSNPQAQYQNFTHFPPNLQFPHSYGRPSYGQSGQTAYGQPISYEQPGPFRGPGQPPYVYPGQSPYVHPGQPPYMHPGHPHHIQLGQPPYVQPNPHPYSDPNTVPYTSPPPTSHSRSSDSASQTSTQLPPYSLEPHPPVSSGGPPVPAVTRAPSKGGLKMLCLDGGGVRGLASLYLLRQLLGYVGNPRPCEFFDVIGGTSTGGLIAILLGRLCLSIDNCIETFAIMMDTIFKKKHSMVRSIVTNQVQPRFDAAILEQAFKRVISDAGFHSEARFRIEDRAEAATACKTFVVALTQESAREMLLTSYPRPGEQSDFWNQIKIWEAARATSAATSFFAPIKITYGNVSREFLDGAFAANNPIHKLWSEARELFPTGLKTPSLSPELPPPSSTSFESNVRLVLSIGTGRPPLQSFGSSLSDVGNSIIRIAAETQATAEQFLENHEELSARGGYFRFNPPDLYREVGLEEAGKRSIIMERTEAYGSSMEMRGTIKQFKSVVAGSYVPKPIEHYHAHAPSVVRPFYELGMGPKYIRRNEGSYWRHLTLESYEIYEKIYRECRSSNGLVHYRTFTQQFNSDRPPRALVRSIWSRLLRDRTSISESCHPKGFVLAVLYMLHIETTLENKLPVDENGVKGRVKEARRELLKRFGNWVRCKCGGSAKDGTEGCTVDWCFANDIGLWRGGEIAKKGCACVKLQDKTSRVQMLFAGKAAKQLAETRGLWEESVVSKKQ
ncbi:MAG: hypothetical protein MMC33_009496 [Icmadophila ericetorum]|nr:hypothetical protein [Icmadophila ericetorum]